MDLRTPCRCFSRSRACARPPRGPPLELARLSGAVDGLSSCAAASDKAPAPSAPTPARLSVRPWAAARRRAARDCSAGGGRTAGALEGRAGGSMKWPLPSVLFAADCGSADDGDDRASWNTSGGLKGEAAVGGAPPDELLWCGVSKVAVLGALRCGAETACSWDAAASSPAAEASRSGGAIASPLTERLRDCTSSPGLCCSAGPPDSSPAKQAYAGAWLRRIWWHQSTVDSSNSLSQLLHT